MSWDAYLASIDWIGAMIAAAVALAVGMVLLRILTVLAAELGIMLPGLGRLVGRAVLGARGDLPEAPWRCATCDSVNPPTAGTCYRGCGPAPLDVERLAVDPDAVVLRGRGGNGRRT